MPSYTRKVAVPGRSKKEIYEAIDQHIGKLLEKFSMAKFDLTRDAAAGKIELNSSMFSASLVCADESVTLDGKLSLMAMPFRGQIDEGIDKFVNKVLSKGKS